jgi:hypothetical protein
MLGTTSLKVVLPMVTALLPAAVMTATVAAAESRFPLLSDDEPPAKAVSGQKTEGQ